MELNNDLITYAVMRAREEVGSGDDHLNRAANTAMTLLYYNFTVDEVNARESAIKDEVFRQMQLSARINLTLATSQMSLR